MNDQTRRAADFDRRMRWSWLRRELRGADPVEAGPVDDVVDLRPTEEQAEPPQED